MRLLAIITLVSSALAAAQTPTSPAATPSFEVASVKPNTSGSTSSRSSTGKGTATISNTTARALIANAYGVRANRVVEGPSWLDDERFDITARAPEGTPDSQIRLMLRTLLAERFKLVVRAEVRDEPVYALVLARADGRLGPALRPSTECAKGGLSGGSSGAGLAIQPLQAGQPAPCGTRRSSDPRGSVILGGAVTLTSLAGVLNGTGNRDVVDRTGLTGTFDFELRYAPEALRAAAGDSDIALPSVFTAVQEQLGLRLESQRGPVEYLVIDNVERPTPN